MAAITRSPMLAFRIAGLISLSSVYANLHACLRQRKGKTLADSAVQLNPSGIPQVSGIQETQPFDDLGRTGFLERTRGRRTAIEVFVNGVWLFRNSRFTQIASLAS
jgi:hypothetical protein